MAKTKTTAAKPDQTTDQDKISIPVAIRGGSGKSAAELLAGLASKAKAPEKKADKKQHPELPLEQPQQQTFVRFAKTKQLYDVVFGELKSVKAEINEILFDAWTSGLWIQKAWPSSPAVKVHNEVSGKLDAEALYIVQEKIKIQIPDNDAPVESIIEGLTAPSQKEDCRTEPLTAADAAALVAEIDFTPQFALRSFSELVDGHWVDRVKIEATDAEKAVGQKLLEFVTNNLTAEEQALVLLNKPSTVVKKGFLQRLTSHVKSHKQLVRALQYFVPTNYPKGAKFGASLTQLDRAKSLVDFADELLGAADLDACNPD